MLCVRRGLVSPGLRWPAGPRVATHHLQRRRRQRCQQPDRHIPQLRRHRRGAAPRAHEPRAGRKMGHFTVIGADQETVVVNAIKARAELGIG